MTSIFENVPVVVTTTLLNNCFKIGIHWLSRNKSFGLLSQAKVNKLLKGSLLN